jgi:hypothetical protein
VHPAHHAHPVERGQVTADGLGGDLELLGQLDHRQSAATADQVSHRLLAFLGVHRSPLRASVYVLF